MRGLPTMHNQHHAVYFRYMPTDCPNWCPTVPAIRPNISQQAAPGWINLIKKKKKNHHHHHQQQQQQQQQDL